MEIQSLLAAGGYQLPQNITVEGRGIHNIIFRLCRMKHTETVMVAGGESNVLCARVLDGFSPIIGVEADGIEAARSLGVLVLVQIPGMQIPLPLGKRAVNAPMQKYAEFLGAEDFARLDVGRRGIVGLGKRAQNGCQENGGEEYKSLHSGNINDYPAKIGNFWDAGKPEPAKMPTFAVQK